VHLSASPAAPLLALLAGFVVAIIATPAGVSGAFLLVPFQLSVLGVAGPSVTATNLLYNVISTPGGIARFRMEGRLDRSLAGLVAMGSLPGVLVGVFLRVEVFARPATFKPFVGAVLLVLATTLLTRSRSGARARPTASGARFAARRGSIVAVSLAVGIVGGIYGVGGGSMLAPYLVGLAGLSIYRVAGATLLATLLTSVVGVAAFAILASASAAPEAQGPDWALGLLFGAGGLVGGYLGARLQQHLPVRLVEGLLTALVTALGIYYVVTGASA